MKKSAIISSDEKYRYQLSRIFDEDLLPVVFVGLNPSIADANIDDKTIIKCSNYCKNWGYGGFHMVNLFAFRSTNPENLFKENDPVGKENNTYLKNVFATAGKIVCCWGNLGKYQNRNVEVLNMIDEPYCLKITKAGEPAHPLYLSSDLEPIDYNLYKKHSPASVAMV